MPLNYVFDFQVFKIYDSLIMFGYEQLTFRFMNILATI